MPDKSVWAADYRLCLEDCLGMGLGFFCALAVVAVPLTGMWVLAKKILDWTLT